MNQAQRIADQLRRAVDGPAWSGPSLADVLKGVTATQAAARPLAGAHSIWEITLHIAVWVNVPRSYLRGERPRVTAEEDWAAVSNAGDAVWPRDRERVFADLRSFADEIAALSDARLQDIVPSQSEKQYTVYALLHGVVQHVLYHAGQIALLKKAVAGDQ